MKMTSPFLSRGSISDLLVVLTIFSLCFIRGICLFNPPQSNIRSAAAISLQAKAQPTSGCTSYLKQMFGLKDRVAIVTGSTRGIGRGVAEALYRAGACVVINGRNPETVKGTLEDIYNTVGSGDKSRLLAVPGDISSLSFSNNVVLATVSHFGHLDILVNNAGIKVPENNFEDNALGDWETVANTNLRGPIDITRAALPYLKKSDRGRIINLCSIAGHVGRKQNTLYAITKGGMLLFTKSLALELAESTVTVNSVSPGVIFTNLNAQYEEGSTDYAALMRSIPKQRMGTVDELRGAFVMLCSEAGSYLTGADIVVDGGFSAI